MSYHSHCLMENKNIKIRSKQIKIRSKQYTLCCPHIVPISKRSVRNTRPALTLELYIILNTVISVVSKVSSSLSAIVSLFITCLGTILYKNIRVILWYWIKQCLVGFDYSQFLIATGRYKSVWCFWPVYYSHWEYLREFCNNRQCLTATWWWK